jgi:Ferritin-like domain
MNLLDIVEQIGKVDPEFQDRVSPRRAAIKNITSFGSKVAVAALPFALGTLLKKAYADTAPTAVTDVLNFALTLEYLESQFYDTGVKTSGLVPPADLNYIQSIRNDEDLHVAFLQGAITSLGGTPVPITNFTFDFTSGGTATGPTNNGPFKTVFSDYQIFLAVAETFEDTGVRAYKGQAPNLLGNAVLTYALDIHAVEARHASAVRYLRTSKYGASVMPWITSTTTNSNDTGLSLVDGNYAGATPENTTVQGGVDITKLPSATGSSTSVAIATAAFDEPLTKDEILALLIPAFIQSA